MLLAAHALGEAAKETKLTLNGKPVAGPLVRSLTAAEIAASEAVIANEGEAEVDAVVSVIGAALTPEPAMANGFTLERSYYTLAGQKLDLKSAAAASPSSSRTSGSSSCCGSRRRRRAAACCSSIACRRGWRSRTRGSWRAAT